MFVINHCVLGYEILQKTSLIISLSPFYGQTSKRVNRVDADRIAANYLQKP